MVVSTVTVTKLAARWSAVYLWPD